MRSARLRAALLWGACLGLLAVAPGQATTGWSFLPYGVDARAVVVGEAVTSLVQDASACFWNPAGLGRSTGAQLLLSHAESFADLRHEFVAVTQPVGAVTGGVFFNGVWTDDQEGFDEYANPTGPFGWSTYEAGVCAGGRIGRGLCLGGAVKMLREDIGAYHADGWAGDLGAQWAPSAKVPVRLGLTVRNIGPATKFISVESTLPATVQGGVSYTRKVGGPKNQLTLAADLKSIRGDGTSILCGAEYVYDALLSFGAGYQSGQDTRDLSLGLGVQRGRYAFHWAYVPFAAEVGHQDESRFSLRIGL